MMKNDLKNQNKHKSIFVAFPRPDIPHTYSKNKSHTRDLHVYAFYLVTVMHVVERVGEGLGDGMALRDDRRNARSLAPDGAVAAGGVEGVLLFGVVAVDLDELHSVDAVGGSARSGAGGEWPGGVGAVG